MENKNVDFNTAFQDYVKSPKNNFEKNTVDYFLRNKMCGNKKSEPNSQKKNKNRSVNFIDKIDKDKNVAEVINIQAYKEFNIPDYESGSENDEKVMSIEESDKTVQEHCTCNIF